MKVQYDEGPDALTIPEAGKLAERGEAVEVPDPIAIKLIDQGWSPAEDEVPETFSAAAFELALEEDIVLTSITGTGKGGNVTVRDVEKKVAEAAEDEPTTEEAEPVEESTDDSTPGPDGEEAGRDQGDQTGEDAVEDEASDADNPEEGE